MDSQEPTLQRGLRAEILNSAVWLERIIYLGVGGLLGLLFAIGGGDIASSMAVGFGAAFGFYVLQSLTLFLWETQGLIGKVVAACILGPGVGLVVLGIGDLIRLAAYQLYVGDKPVFFAFLGKMSKADRPKRA